MKDIVDAFCHLHRGTAFVRPAVLTLSLNYRCAPSVAALAGAVTGLLLRRFPNSADRIVIDIHMGGPINYSIFFFGHLMGVIGYVMGILGYVMGVLGYLMVTSGREAAFEATDLSAAHPCDP